MNSISEFGEFDSKWLLILVQKTSLVHLCVVRPGGRRRSFVQSVPVLAPAT